MPDSAPHTDGDGKVAAAPVRRRTTYIRGALVAAVITGIVMIVLGFVALSADRGTPWKYAPFLISDVDGMATVDFAWFSVSFEGDSMGHNSSSGSFLVDGRYFNHPVTLYLKDYDASLSQYSPSQIHMGYDQTHRLLLLSGNATEITFSYHKSELTIGTETYSLAGGKRTFIISPTGEVRETTPADPEASQALAD